MGLLQRCHAVLLALGHCADKGDGKRYIVHSDELLSGFLKLEAISLLSKM
jgi:hypothetical protein